MARDRSVRFSAVAAAFAILLAACQSASPSASESAAESASAPESVAPPSGTITISNWDAYFPADLLANFTAETGIEVELSLHTTNEDIMGKLEAQNGGGYDLVFMSAQFAKVANERGWAEQLDHSLIPNLTNLAPEATQLANDPGNVFSVPYSWGTTGLCWRSDLVTEEIDSWADLLQPADELKGKITMLATDRWLLLPAQKLLGQSVNSTDQAELEAARDLLISAKENLLAYDDTTFYTRLVTGEAWLVEAWDGWCDYGIAEDPNISWVVPSEGSDLWADTMVVMEQSDNKAAAHAFINYILRADVGVTVVENIFYKVPNTAAMALVDPALIEQFPNLGMSAAELFAGEALQDLGDAQTLYTQIVTEVTSS